MATNKYYFGVNPLDENSLSHVVKFLASSDNPETKKILENLIAKLIDEKKPAWKIFEKVFKGDRDLQSLLPDSKFKNSFTSEASSSAE